MPLDEEAGGETPTPEQQADAEAEAIANQDLGESYEGDEDAEGDEDVVPGEEKKTGEGEGDLTEEQKAEVAETHRKEMLGLVPQEPVTVESLSTENKALKATAKSQAERQVALDAYYEDRGVKMVQKSDGSFGLAATEKFVSEFDPTTLGVETSKIYSGLSPEEKALFESDEEAAATMIADKAVKLAAGSFAEKRLLPDTKTEDAVLPGSDHAEVAQTFMDAKFSDGKTPMFPDAQGKVMDLMSEVYQRDGHAAEEFRRFCNRDKDCLYYGMSMLYSSVFRAMAPKQAIEIAGKKADAEKSAQQRKQATPGGGSARPDAAGGEKGGEDEAALIAKSDE